MQAFNARLLVVDDDEQFRKVLAQALTSAGFEVLQAGNLAKALAVLDSSGAADLLIADLHLSPGTPHGFSTGRVIKMRCPQIKIVFMTGGDAQGFALREPGDVVLQKPFRTHELIDAVKAALRRE